MPRFEILIPPGNHGGDRRSGQAGRPGGDEAAYLSDSRSVHRGRAFNPHRAGGVSGTDRRRQPLRGQGVRGRKGGMVRPLGEQTHRHHLPDDEPGQFPQIHAGDHLLQTLPAGVRGRPIQEFIPRIGPEPVKVSPFHIDDHLPGGDAVPAFFDPVRPLEIAGVGPRAEDHAEIAGRIGVASRGQCADRIVHQGGDPNPFPAPARQRRPEQRRHIFARHARARKTFGPVYQPSGN